MGTDFGTDDVTHHRFAHRKFLRWTEHGIFRKSCDISLESATYIEEQPRARCAVMPALTQRLEKRITSELWHEIA